MNIAFSMIVAAGNGGFIRTRPVLKERISLTPSAVSGAGRVGPAGALDQTRFSSGPHSGRAVKQAGGNEARIFWRGTDWFRSKPSLSKCHSGRSKIYNYKQPTYRTYPIDFRDICRIAAKPPAVGVMARNVHVRRYLKLE